MRDFRKQKKRMTLTILAIAWGTISIMLLLAFGEGLQRQMRTNQYGLGKDIMIVWGGQTSIPFEGLGKGRYVRFTVEDLDYLHQQAPEFKNLCGEYVSWGNNMRYKDNVISERVTGVYPCYEEIRTHYPEAGGRFLNNLDMEQKRRVVFLGGALKKKLFGEENAVGEQILINSLPFTVIGVMKDKIQMGMYNGPDENMAAIPATTFSAIYGYRNFTLIAFQPPDPLNSKPSERKLFELMGAKHKFDPNDDQTLRIRNVAEDMREFGNVLFGVEIFLGIIGGMSLLIAGVGVANIMYVSIKERTREIGIKMAVGAKKKYILTQFLIESLLITGVGGFFGMSISYVLTEAFKRVPIQSDVMDFMGRPTVSFEIGLVVVIVLGVIGILSGIFPAIKAASVNPVESLRYE
jgi:putative ABC transport system permease protein